MNEPINRIDVAVSLFSKTGTINDVGISCATTARLPLVAHSTCKAISQHSGQSMNRVLVEVIEVGLELVMGELPDEDRKAIEKIRAGLVHEAIQGGEFESGEIK